MSDDIIRKIRALQNITVDNGASEDEMATAMRLAAGLMLKHGIQQSQLGTEPPKAKMGDRIKAQFERYQVALACAAATLYGCRVVVFDRGKTGLYFAGREENIEAATHTTFFLVRQVESLYKQKLQRGLTQRQRSEYRRTFKFACALRVQKRAEAMMALLQESNREAQQSTGQTALVVRTHYQHLLSEADKLTEGMEDIEFRQKAGSGTKDGMRAGDQVKLREELGHDRKLIQH